MLYLEHINDRDFIGHNMFAILCESSFDGCIYL